MHVYSSLRVSVGSRWRVTASGRASTLKSPANMPGSAFVRNFDAMMDKCRAGEPISVEDRIRYRYDSAIVADRCLALSSRMLKAAGSGGVRLGSELLDYHLDILCSQAHVANHSVPFANNMGGVMFGEDNVDYAI